MEMKTISKKTTVPRGTVVLLSEGAYSSYGVVCLCRALSDFRPYALREEYFSLNEDERPTSGNRQHIPVRDFKVYKFVKWLIVDKKLLEEIEYDELFLGDYGDADFCLGYSQTSLDE